MRRSLQLAYWEGYAEGVAGTCLDARWASRKWQYQYKLGQRDGKEDRRAVQEGMVFLPRRDPEKVRVP